MISFSIWQSPEFPVLSRYRPTNLFTKRISSSQKKSVNQLRARASIPAGSEYSWVFPGHTRESSTPWLPSFNLRNRTSTGCYYYLHALSPCSSLQRRPSLNYRMCLYGCALTVLHDFSDLIYYCLDLFIFVIKVVLSQRDTECKCALYEKYIHFCFIYFNFLRN